MPSPSLNSLVGFDRKLVVGVGGLAVSNDQSAMLTTYSLGSCLGITIFDPVSHVGGLLHAMLPDSSINNAKAADQPAMFVDTGLAALFRAAYQLHLDKYRARICVVGGAQFLDKSGFFNIGQRNIKCFRELLQQHALNVAAEEVGGLVSRTIQLNIGTGEVRLRTSGNNEDCTLWHP